MNKKEYLTPTCVIVNIAISQMIASSMTGTAPDSNDTEFGAPAQRRGTWGNLWEHNWGSDINN